MSNRSEEFMKIDLMRRMLELKPTDRPSIKEVLHHILFWTGEKRYTFICDISETLNVLRPDGKEVNAKVIKNYEKTYKDGKHKTIENVEPAIKKLKAALNANTIDTKQLNEICNTHEFEDLNKDTSYTQFIRRFRNKVKTSINYQEIK